MGMILKFKETCKMARPRSSQVARARMRMALLNLSIAIACMINVSRQSANEERALLRLLP